MHFEKESGATIEIFLLTPVLPSAVVQEAMQAQKCCTWKCTIGNQKRWNINLRLSKRIHNITIEARLVDKEAGLVEFSWSGESTFAAIVSLLGETPLPPYLKREPENSDRERYQTVYAYYEGAVAAPTAGLHFTPAVLRSLQEKGFHSEYMTLHVSAGTFLPIKADNPAHHVMHTEQVIVTRENIEHLFHHNHITAVGTTSLRTLESLYWYGVKLIRDPLATFVIHQDDPYNETEKMPPAKDALRATLSYLDRHKTNILVGETSIYIVPGYTFRMCDALITNFHQPKSTLILLVAAFLGSDWKTVYRQAVDKNYRFLSYGDSSLLIRSSTHDS
jgi:S-adenosylmethionine:tRNA ribosyltransferase-isomerase